MADSVYRSEIDSWLLGVFAAGALTSVLVCAGFFYFGGYFEWVLGLLALASGVGIPLWVITSTTYTLSSGFLGVRCGPFHWEVPLRRITKVTAVRSPTSSPALSLDRLRIEYDTHVLMISPDDRRRFIEDLRTRGVTAA